MAVYDWFRRLSRAKSASSDSGGWTHNLSINLRPGRTLDELVAAIFAARKEGRQHELVIAQLREEFGLSVEDAQLAIDRVCSGIVRAMTGNRANCPDRTRDPIGWLSFQRSVGKR